MQVSTSEAATSLVHPKVPPLSEGAGTGLPNTAALRIIHLEALRDVLEQRGTSPTLTNWLTEKEQQLFAGFSLPKRRLEWLGGRITAKASLLNLLADRNPSVNANRLEILPDGSGRPYLTSLDTALPGKLSFSISHSGVHAAALACLDQSCGLDIQLLSPVLEGIKERFSTSTERRLLQSCPQLSLYGKIEQLALLWSAKEAIRKTQHLSPLPGFLEMRLTEEPRSEGEAFFLAASFSRAGHLYNFSVTSWLENGMALAITFF